MQAAREHREHNPEEAKKHYINAAIAGAIALGAYEMLRRDEEKRRHGHGGHHVNLGDDLRDDEESHRHRSRSSSRASDYDESEDRRRERRHSESDPAHQSGHNKDLLVETLGAYALGRQMMGHKSHPIVKLIAEGLGVAGLSREAYRELNE
jgi:hypothetical protein